MVPPRYVRVAKADRTPIVVTLAPSWSGSIPTGVPGACSTSPFGPTGPGTFQARSVAWNVASGFSPTTVSRRLRCREVRSITPHSTSGSAGRLSWQSWPS